MKHRYIFCGVVWEDPRISSYRLISNTRYSGGQLVRVNISDDLEISHYSGDGYSTTYDNRSIHDLGCDCYILYKGHWRKFNWLKQIEPHQWFRALEYIFGLHNCYDDKIGWTDDINLWKEIFYSKARKELTEKCTQGTGTKHYPPLKEDKKGLKLKVHLGNIDWLRHNNEDEWIKIYDKLKKQLDTFSDTEIWCE